MFTTPVLVFAAAVCAASAAASFVVKHVFDAVRDSRIYAEANLDRTADVAKILVELDDFGQIDPARSSSTARGETILYTPRSDTITIRVNPANNSIELVFRPALYLEVDRLLARWTGETLMLTTVGHDMTADTSIHF